MLGAQVTRSAIVHMDLEGRITSINPAAMQIFSVDEHQAVGLPYTSVFGASISNRLLRLFMQASKVGDHGGLQEMHVKRPDGQMLALRASVTTQRDGAGTPIGFVFLAQGADPDADRELPAGTAAAAIAAPTAPGPASPAGSALQPADVHRTITVLHAEVRGYAALATVLAPAAVSALLSRYHRAAVAALQQAGATVDASVVGTILALWNGPEPQEDHARRALRGALALQAAVGAIGGELRYAVGIHTGEAQVTNIGTAHAPLFSAVGLTVHIATSLQRQTEAGGINCSRVTLVAAGSGVRSTALGPLAIRGLDRGVDAFAVLGVAPGAISTPE
jgi:PAS domain S-box-containing protein